MGGVRRGGAKINKRESKSARPAYIAVYMALFLHRREDEGPIIIYCQSVATCFERSPLLTVVDRELVTHAHCEMVLIIIIVITRSVLRCLTLDKRAMWRRSFDYWCLCPHAMPVYKTVSVIYT